MPICIFQECSNFTPSTLHATICSGLSQNNHKKNGYKNGYWYQNGYENGYRAMQKEDARRRLLFYVAYIQIHQTSR